MLQYSLQFNYTIHLVPDGSYGTQDPNTGEWNGMMAELVNTSPLHYSKPCSA